MTIYLPEGLNLFRQALDAACDRILRNEKDAAFYALSLELIARLQEHPLLKDYVLELEAKCEKREQEFSVAALEALEDSWMRLWKYHCHSWRHRKRLVYIKRMITAPDALSYTPVYPRILFSMREFRYHSPLCSFIDLAPQLFRKARSELNPASIRFNHFCPLREGYFANRKVVLRKLSKKDKRQHLHSKIFNPGPAGNAMPFRRSAELLPEALFSPKVDQVEKRFSTPGQNSDEKRQNMQIMAETNPIFCWGRMRFLRKCYTANVTLSVPKQSRGRWPLVRETAWKSAFERCEIEALLRAKMNFQQKLSSDRFFKDCPFLMCEHQVHRRDYEKYLQSLKNHIHAQLFKIESMQQETATDSRLMLPGTQKEDFVVDLARKFWKSHPFGKRDDAYDYYVANCHYSRRLLRDRWEQIVRKRKLDPRPPAAKKRGPGKKTFQN
jgi:hypothetical protein